MKVKIQGYDLWKVELPTGRVIGDCTCHYDAIDVLVLCLKTDQGHLGWGFGEAISNGVFAKPAPWIKAMPSLDEMRRDFEANVWPILQGRNPFQLTLHRPLLFQEYSYLELSVHIALWDLMGKILELPLYQLLGAKSDHNRVYAYGSGLDFPLSEGEAVGIFKSFIRRGFTAMKVKVGAPKAERDIRRLQAVREAVGDKVEIAIDGNEAWTCDEAIDRINLFQREGIRLSYVEDLLPRNDLEGIVRLNASVDVDVVGHDYLTDPRVLRRYVERKAFNRIRVMRAFDHALACSDIAEDFGIPLIFGNSLFEIDVHVAVAVPRVDRLEFSDLAWNMLPKHPVRFENGYAIAPAEPGHGLDPNMDMLKQLSKPEAGVPPRPPTTS
jgi:L-alanine-DL-glutamate epimerase-like enolase superfamily enzyme